MMEKRFKTLEELKAAYPIRIVTDLVDDGWEGHYYYTKSDILCYIHEYGRENVKILDENHVVIHHCREVKRYEPEGYLYLAEEDCWIPVSYWPRR